MIKAVVYDLDGTLLDTITTISGNGNSALEAFGLKTFSPDEYKYFVGDGAKNLILRMIRAAGADENEYFEPVFAYYNELYDSAPTHDTKPYPGICELVEKIKDLGIKQAVLSNKPDFATKSAVRGFFGDVFDKVYGGREGVKLKPCPDALYALLNELEVSADECVYVGDTSVDMKTGKSAGAYTVGVLWGFRDRRELEENGADVIVNTPLEILEIINSQNNKET